MIKLPRLIVLSLLVAAPAFGQGPPMGTSPLGVAGAASGSLGPQSWMLATNGLNLPLNPFTPGSYQAFEVSQHTVWTAPYATTNCRIGYAGYSLAEPGTWEVLLPNPITIRGATWLVHGQRYPVTFGGSLTGTVPNTAGAAFLWSDPIPITNAPSTRVQIITNINWVVATSGAAGTFTVGALTNVTTSGGYFRNEFVNFGTTQIDAIYNGTQAHNANNYVGTTNGYSASMIACQGGDGRPVFFLDGDSEISANGEIFGAGDAFGNYGLIPRMLNGVASNSPLAVSATRWPWASSGLAGASAGQITGTSSLANTVAMLKGIPGQGTPIFNTLLLQKGTNDNAAAASWESALSTEIGAWASSFPGTRIVQFGWPPRENCGTLLCAPGDTLTQFNTHFGGTGSDSFVTQTALSNFGLTNNPGIFLPIDYLFSQSQASGTVGTWALTYASGAYASTLSAAATSGGHSIQMTASAANPLPARGQCIVVDTGGTPEQFLVLGIQLAPDNTAQLYLQTFGEGTGTLAHNHSSGATVKGCATGDGIHSDGVTNAAAAAVLNPAFAALVQ